MGISTKTRGHLTAIAHGATQAYLLTGGLVRIRYVELHETGEVIYIVVDQAGLRQKIPACDIREVTAQ